MISATNYDAKDPSTLPSQNCVLTHKTETRKLIIIKSIHSS